MKILQKIIERIRKMFARSKYLDIKSRKCLSEIRKVLRWLEQESFGYYNWQYRRLDELNLVDAGKLADEYILISQKMSKLQARERDLVTGIVGMAVVKCIEK